MNNGYILSKEIVELLKENRLGSILFKPFISVYEFIERILELSSRSIDYLNKIDSKKNKSIIYSYERFAVIFNKISTSQWANSLLSAYK